VDVTKKEGLRPGLSVWGVEVLGRAKQPVESHDCEELDVRVEGSEEWVLGVKGIEHCTEDGDVDRIGPGRRVIVFGQGFDEISE